MYNKPSYNAATIPYSQLTHIVHSNIAPAAKGDGSLFVPSGFLEPELLTNRAHAVGVKVELCVSGAAGLFVKIDEDASLRATFAQNIANFAIERGYELAWTSIMRFHTIRRRPRILRRWFRTYGI